jgi:hypothetical protein
MPDVDASVLAIVFHFSLYSCSRLSRLELEIRDYEVKVDEIVEWLFWIFFRIRTDCMTIRPTSVIIALMGAIHEECRTDINHGSTMYQGSLRCR